MFSKAKRIIGNERGITFLEAALYVVLIVFVVAIAGADLGGALSDKWDALTSTVRSVSVPSI